METSSKAPSPNSIPKRLPRAKPPERFIGDEILLSSANQEQVEVQKYFNPDLEFSPMPINTLTSSGFPILSGILNTNPRFSSPQVSASLGMNPELHHP